MPAVVTAPAVRASVREKRERIPLKVPWSKTISIDCEAVKCVYNTNYKCHAEHVDIRGCGACDCESTACATFKER